MLLDLGHVNVRTAQRRDTATKAPELIEAETTTFDCNLAGDLSFPLAEVLERRKSPFMFSTGYGRVGLDDRFPGAVVIATPFRGSPVGSRDRQTQARGIAKPPRRVSPQHRLSLDRRKAAYLEPWKHLNGPPLSARKRRFEADRPRMDVLDFGVDAKPESAAAK
jgi:hypothetical protein